MKYWLHPIGPIFAFVIPWTLVLMGQLFPLCKIIDPSFTSFHILILSNIASLFFVIFCFTLKVRERPLEMLIPFWFKKRIYFLLKCYLLLQSIQMVYFKGVPLLWLLQGSHETYFDYGIPSMNGLMNAIYLLVTTSIALFYLQGKKKRDLFLLIILLFIPILVISRQLLMSLFFQVCCLTLMLYPKLFFRYTFFAVALLFVFIEVGNFRTSLDHLVFLLEPYPWVPKLVYPLLWIYAYIVTPFNNINASMDQIVPVGNFHYQLSSLLPTPLRNIFFTEKIETGFSLVHSKLTVSTFYYEPIMDFGLVYAFFFMMLFQIFLVRSYQRAVETKKIFHLIEYSILFMITILSVFSNLLLFLPISFQFIMLKFMKLRLLKKHNIQYLVKNELC